LTAAIGAPAACYFAPLPHVTPRSNWNDTDRRIAYLKEKGIGVIGGDDKPAHAGAAAAAAAVAPPHRP
jgi:hypothetical protein